MFSPEKIAFKPFAQKAFLATPTMHGEELDYIRLAYDTNWMSTVGENINEVERIAAEKAEVGYAVGLACCTAALHLCVKLAGERLYGKPPISHGALEGRRVFCSDMTFDATLNPVVYEGGIPVFIDTEADSWNMDPIALEKAFTLYPEVKLVVMAHLYGFPAKVDEIKRICEKHGALLIEDAAEAMGATVNGKQCGSFGDYAAISYNGNKIITGSAGGCLLTNSLEDANRARKWATQARENAPWCALTAKPFTAQRQGSPAPRKFWKFWQSTTPRAAPSGSPCICSPCTGCTSAWAGRGVSAAAPTPISQAV